MINMFTKGLKNINPVGYNFFVLKISVLKRLICIVILFKNIYICLDTFGLS